MLGLTRYNDMWNTPMFTTTRMSKKMISPTEHYNTKCISQREEDGSLKIAIPVPGVDKKDIDISVKSGLVTVEYKGKILNRDMSGKVEYSVHQEYDIDCATAEVREGVLYINFPPNKDIKNKIKIK